ncbi:hypothetical protein EDB85DRAFT_1896674 [Lactarius pseudohatsudake]|nr:hypothetical protein EDB85DRAFT_1896674 [Lactarius pseudohatsudake]
MAREAGSAWPRAPLPARTGRRARVNPLPREYPRVPPPRAYRAARQRGKGGAGRRTTCDTLPREWGKGGASHAPFPRVRGGAAKGEGMPGAACEWGRVEPGVACPRDPRAYGVARPRGKGRGGGVPRVPGGAKREGEEGGGDAERRGGVPSCAPLPREWGREGPGSGVPHVPPFRANGVVRRGKGKRAGRSALVVPLPREWGREGRGVVCPCVSPFRASCLRTPPVPREWGGTAKGEGRGRGVACLACPLSARTGRRSGEREAAALCALPREWGRKGPGGRVPSCAPFPGGAAKWEGEGRGPRALVCPLSARMGCHGQGKGGRWHALVRPLPRKRGGADGREGRAREAEGHCVPYLRAKGAAAVNAREGWVGGRLTSCAPLCARCGASACPLASLFDANGVDEGGEEAGKEAEATRACHVSASAYVAGTFCFRHRNRVCKERPLPLLPPPPHPRHPPISAAVPICVEGRKRAGPCITRRPVRAQTGVHQERGRTRKGGAHEGMPPPLPPVRVTPPAQKGGARGRVVWAPMSRLPPSPPPVPLSAPPIRTEGMHMRAPGHAATAVPHSRGRGDAAPSPSPVPPFPPWRKGAHKGMPPLSPLPPLDRHAREGTLPPAPPLTAPPPPHPSTFARQRGAPHAAAPSPLTSPPHTRGKGAREGIRAEGGACGHAAPYAREECTRGHTTPGPSHPRRPQPPFPLDLTTPYAREGGTRRPGPSLPHSCGRGAYDTAPLSRVAPASLPFPLRATCEGKPPHPVAPRLRGKGRTRPSRPRLPTCRAAGPARSQCARVHRAIVQLRQKIDVA